MSLELLAEGNQIETIKDAESYIPEGANAELRLYLKSAPSWVITPAVWTLNQTLKLAGVPLREDVKYEAGIVSIKWRKGFPFLAAIVAAIIAVAVIIMLFLAWQLFEEVAKTPLLIIPLILIGVGVFLFAIKGKKALPGR